MKYELTMDEDGDSEYIDDAGRRRFTNYIPVGKPCEFCGKENGYMDMGLGTIACVVGTGCNKDE